MKPNRIAPITLTKSQRAWLDAEQARTGNPISAIMRSLIQEKIDNKKSEAQK